MAIDDRIRKLIDDKSFAALTTLFPDGSPQTQIIWVGADEDHLLINTEVHRQKYRNVQRDPRVALTIWDAANPYTFAEVRGTVVGEVRGPEARADIDALSRHYTGNDYSDDAITSERVTLRIRPDKVVTKGL